MPAWVPDLPAAPGVYVFTDAHGQPLYVGKSVNLRRRVRGYFYSGGPTSERMAEMLRIARGVESHPAGSDLEARLVEAEWILDRRPPYNKALKRRATGWYVQFQVTDPFPRLSTVRRPRGPSHHFSGPYWGRRAPDRIRHLVEKLAQLRTCTEVVAPQRSRIPCMQYDMKLCSAPCAARVDFDGYHRQVALAQRLMRDTAFVRDMRSTFEGARDACARRMEYERATEAQLRVSWLAELEELHYALDPRDEPRSWLIVLPGTDGCRTLQPVARGRVLRRSRVPWTDGAWQPAVEDACYAVRVAELRGPSALTPREAVPSQMVGRWLEEGCPDGWAIDLDEVSDVEAVAQLRWLAA